MSDVSSEQLRSVLIRMRYELVADGDGIAMYLDMEYPGYPERLLKFDFSRGAIPVRDLQRQLEHEGVPVEAFFAELEAIFG